MSEVPQEQTKKYLPGDTVDKAYQLTKLLGKGGMGVVYSCKHLALQKTYALKILMADQLESEAWARFKIEAKALAKLNHPGIVGIYNMGIDKGVSPYYVMDLLSGESLDVIIREHGPVPTIQALELFAGVADALGSAHAHGIIHRDIKPSNLMLVRDPSGNIDQLKIVDFGIARLTNKGGHNMQSQTATGVVFGTPFYMSPEQCRGDRVDERSDIYSFGCTLFEVLTGRPPFMGKNAFDTIMKHMNEAPPTLSEVRQDVEFPQALDELIEKTLSKDLCDRYQNMGQVKHDLERIRAGKVLMRKVKSGSYIDDQATTELNAEDEYEYEEEEQERRALSQALVTPVQLAITVITAAIVLVAGVFFFIKDNIGKQPESTDKKVVTAKLPNEDLNSAINAIMKDKIKDPEAVRKAGLSQADTEEMLGYDWPKFKQGEREFKKRFEAYLQAVKKTGIHFSRSTVKSRVSFLFPENFYLLALKIGEKKPITPLGIVSVPASQDLCIYLSEPTDDCPQLLDGFGANDLTGVEMKFKDASGALRKLGQWHRLKDLCFFNSLIKALPNNESRYDESPVSDSDLPAINRLNLRSLGLCGPKITGAEVLKMPLIHKLQGLKVKRISDMQTLLKGLPKLDNISELWIIAQDIGDSDLEPLTRMTNLKTLRIRRSQLTPSSVQYFAKMHSLQHLLLDRSWKAEEKTEFQKAIPVCQFEKVLDQEYWKFVPE